MAQRTKGTVVEIGGKWYARHRINGKSVYGPARLNRDDADRDRLNTKPTRQLTDGSTFAEWAYSVQNSD